MPELKTRAEDRQAIDPRLFENLDDATRRYRLVNPTVTNQWIASQLGLIHSLGDHNGMPNCCFYGAFGRLVAIRTKREILSIFHLYQMYQHSVLKFAQQLE